MRRHEEKAMRGTLLRCLGVLLSLATAAAAFAGQPKVIRDPTEYRAYMAALALGDPATKAAAMEAFAARYPASIVRLDALAQAMAAWQQAGNAAKVESDARRIFALDQDNVRALAVIVALERVRATRGDKQAQAALGGHAAEGLRALPAWQQPDGMSDADFRTLRRQMLDIFDGAAGFAALQAERYGASRDALGRAVAIDAGNLQDVYQLGIAELQMAPLDATGFWHVARAMALADAQHGAAAVQAIGAYGKAKYVRYHGSAEGWDAIVARAATETAPPPDFARGLAKARSTAAQP
jgi:hypothetical protein